MKAQRFLITDIIDCLSNTDLLGSEGLSVALQEVAGDDRADDGQPLSRLQLAGERQQARRLDVGVFVQF